MLSGSTMPIRPPGFNICKQRSRKRICGGRVSSSCVVCVGAFDALSRVHLYPSSYCDNTCSPLIGIFAPNGGLVNSTSNCLSFTLDCATAFQSTGGTSVFSENPGRRAPLIKNMYALHTFTR